MRLVYAFLADAAQFTPDGKLSMLGGDYDTLYATAFPTIHPAVTFVLKLRLEPDEVTTEHIIRVDLEQAGVETRYPSASLHVAPQANADRISGPQHIASVLNFVQIVFPVPGAYTFHIVADDRELGVLPLRLERRAG